MNWQNIADSKIVADLGLTLFHSLWQIALVSFALYTILALTKRASADTRYIISLAALFLAFLIPLATFLSLQQQPGEIVVKRMAPVAADLSAENSSSAAAEISKQ